MNLFLHRVEFQTSTLFDALTDELQAQSEKLQPNEARDVLDSKAMLEADISGWTQRFRNSLRRRVDQLIDGRNEEISDHVAPPAVSALSLVDNSEIEVDVASRVYSQRLGEKSGEDFAKFSMRLAGLLKLNEIASGSNPFGPHVVSGATRDAMEGTFGPTESAKTVHSLRLLTRLSPLDLAAIYRDLDQFLQQRGVLGAGTTRKVERASRPESKRSDAKTSQARLDAVLNDAQLSEQVASALLARVAAMNPGFSAASVGNVGFALTGQRPGFGAQGGSPSPSLGGGGFPQIVPPPSPQQAFPGGMQTVLNSPQLAAMALLGAPVPGATAGAARGMMQVVAPQLLQGVGDVQRDVVMQAVQQMEFPGAEYGSANYAPADVYSTEPLRQLAASPSFASNASALDFTTIELVAMVFDFVFNDRALDEGMKGVLTHLQIPMLKAALIDRNFFASKTHPARVLLNRLAEVGRDWRSDRGQSDPTYVLIRDIVSNVVATFERDMMVFTAATARIDAFVADAQKAAEPIETAEAAVIEIQDKETMSDAWARRSIRERLARAPVPQFVVNFLGGPWLRFLTKIAAENGTSSEPVQRALDDADFLIDSIKDGLDVDQRRKIISRLPKLLTELRAGCTSAHATEPEKRAFFDNMFELHARILKGLQVEIPATTAGQPESVEPARVDIELASAPEDMFREIALDMEKGMWIEMQDDTGKLKLAKLSWISPQRTTYLFTTRQGHKAASLTPVQLAEWFREDRARVLESEPVVDRALDVLLNELVASPR